MNILDFTNSPLKNISDIGGNLAYRGQIISGVGGGISTKLFSPLDIPGLVRWYSASSGILNSSGSPCVDGEKVAVWKNLAQNPYIQGDIQSVKYMEPIYKTSIYNYNYPCLDFGSTGSMSGLHNNFLEGCSNSYTIILKRKMKFESGTAIAYEFFHESAGYPNRIALLAPYSDGYTYFDAGNASTQRISASFPSIRDSGNWQITKGVRRKSSSYFKVNDTLMNSTSSSSWVSSPNQTGLFALGGWPLPSSPGASYAVNSYFSDFLIYDHDLNAGELSLIDQYLNGIKISIG